MRDGNGSKAKKQLVKELPLRKEKVKGLEAECKQAEEALQAEKNKLQSVMDSMEYGLTIQDKDYNIIYQNEITRGYFGDRVGEKCYRVYGDGKKTCEGCPVEKAFKDGKSHAGGRRRVMPSGEVIFWENTASPIRDAKGNIISCLEITRNITERKQTEEALQTEKNKLQSVVDALEYGITIQDRDYNIIYQNEQAKKPFGEHIGEKCYRAYASNEEVCDGCNVTKAFKDGKSHTGERRRVMPSGEVVFWENTASPVRDAKGKIISCLEITRNITERKQAEEALKRTTEDLQLVSLMNDAANQGYSLQKIIQLMAKEAKRIFSCYGVTFYEVSEDRKYLIMQNLALPRTVTHQIEKLIGGKVPQVRIRLQEGSLYWEALQAGKPQIINDPETIQRLIAECTENKLLKKLAPHIYKLLETGSVMQVPLVSEGEVIGLLDMSRKQPFTELELERFVPIAQQALRIIKRKRSKEKTQQQSEFLNSILASLTYPFYVIDVKDYTIKLANPAAKMGDLSEKQTCYALTHKQAKPCRDVEHGCPIAEVKKTKEPVVVEHIHYDEDGNARNIEVHGYPIFDAEGNVVQMIEYCLDITERKQAEEKLQLLSSVTQQVSDATIVTDLGFNITYVNKAAQDLFGYSAEEMLGKSMGDFNAAPLPKKLERGIGQIIASGKLWVGTLGKRRKDGSTFLGECHISSLYDKQGQISSYVDVLQDITARKQMEEALQAEKNKLQSVIGAMEDGLTIQDRDYNIVYQNEPARVAFGGDHLGEKCYRAYEGREKLCDGCPVEKAFKDGKSHIAERKVVLPSGEVAFWETTANPIRDARGEVVSCLEIGRSITERKLAEEALAESEARYRAVVEGTHDMIQSVGLDGRIIFVNKAWLDTLGYTEAELSSLNLFDIIHPDSQAHCQEMFTKVMSGKSLHGIEAAFLTKDGRKILVEGNAAPRYVGDKVVATQGVFRDITERKQAEEALADEVTRRRILIDQSLDGIVILDEDSKVYEANQRFTEMLGYTPEEVRELHTWDWDTQWTKEQLLEMGHKVDEAGLRLETYHRRKDGTVFDVDISINGAVCAGKKLIFCVSRDITERKQAEKALLEAEEKYKNLVGVASDLIWEVDEKGMYTFVSPRIKDVLGYEVDEVVGKMRTLDFAPKKEVRKWLKRFKEVNAKRAAFSGFEVLHLHKNGTPVIFEVSGIPFVDSEGNLKGYVGINKDVTERKQVTEALKESQEFSVGLLENSPNPIFVLNPDTSVKYVNPAFEKLTGFSLAEITGKKAPYPWWLEDEREKMTPALKNTMAQGGKRSEKVFRKKNGERFWVALNSAPVMHQGELLYFLINWLDITERKRAEEEKIELEQKAHLASRLASVGEMASGIAHEINNPLTAVIGFAQLLMDADLPDDLKEDLVIIHKEAQRAAGVARNLLTFARKHAPAKQLTNVNGIIEGVLTLRAYEQNVSNIHIKTKFAPDLPEVMADYSQLQQVFINIILNAETAMLEAGNGGTLTVTTQKVNHSVRASFADDGPGITKENLDRIFDPFFTTKEVGKGTGLGLSVCHGIIAEHGGKVYARSKLGSGATFVVELPVKAHEQLEESNETV